MNDRVLSVMDWQDGPRLGVAEYEGRPHLFMSAFFYCPPELLHVDAKCDYAIEDDIFMLWPIEIDETFRLAVWNNFIHYRVMVSADDREKFRAAGQNLEWLETYEEQTRLVKSRFNFEPDAALLCHAHFVHENPDESFVIWQSWRPGA